MNYYSKLLIACLLCTTTVFYSCNDDDDDPVVNDDPQTESEYDLNYEANPRAFALKFTDFIGDGAENIQRLDSDTVRIAIKDGLLTYLKIDELKKGDVLNIWENIDCPPYIRVVDAAEKTESGYIVTTHEGSIGDIFHSLDACLDTELFSDIADRPVRTETRVAGNEQYHPYVDDFGDFEQFVGEDGRIHPFIFYTATDEDAKEFKFELAELKYDSMIDSLVTPRGMAWTGKWTLIDKEINNINIYPKVNDKGVPLGVFVADAQMTLKADMEIYFKYNVTTSNRFWAKLKGNLGFHIPLHIRMEGKQIQEKQEIPVYEFMPKFTVFPVGPFTIPVVMRHGFIFKGNYALNLNFSMMVPIIYQNAFQVGPKYDNYEWGNVNSFAQHFAIDRKRWTMTPSAGMSVNAGVGFYYHIGAYLGSAVGPFFEIGPKANMSGNAALSGNDLLFNTKASIGLGGFVGAEIKLLKWNLGKFSVPYNIVGADLWDEDFRINVNDLPPAFRPGH